MQAINSEYESLRQEFLGRASVLTRQAPARVMLGDSTVTEQQTFDPAGFRAFLEGTAAGLAGWGPTDVSASGGGDVRRVFARFAARSGDYSLSCHMAVQFHVLLYYRPEARVIECQKELSGIVDRAREGEQQMADAGDSIVLERLRGLGHRDLDHQRLFEVLYSDDALSERMFAEAAGSRPGELAGLAARRDALFGELDSLLVETYQTTPVLIDETRLAAGEEGLVCTVDLGCRGEGLFDAAAMPAGAREWVERMLGQLRSLVSPPPSKE